MQSAWNIALGKIPRPAASMIPAVAGISEFMILAAKPVAFRKISHKPQTLSQKMRKEIECSSHSGVERLRYIANRNFDVSSIHTIPKKKMKVSLIEIASAEAPN